MGDSNKVNDLKRKLKIIDSDGGMLDDIVHAEMSRYASCINNQGIDAQVDFLIFCGNTPESIAEEVEKTL